MGDGMTSVSSSVSPVRLVAAVQRERPVTEMLCHQVERGYGGSRLTTDLLLPRQGFSCYRLTSFPTDGRAADATTSFTSSPW